MRPIAAVLGLVTLWAVIVFCDNSRDAGPDDPYTNPNLQQAVTDFIQTWQHRHHQNADYQFTLRPLSLETSASIPADTSSRNRGNLMTALTADDLPEEFRNSGNIISSISDGNEDGNFIPEHLRPQIPPRPGPSPTPRPETSVCPSCNVSRETDKQLRIAMIQQQILRRLGLKEPPQVNVSEADLHNLIPLRSLLDRPYHRMYHEYEYDVGEDDKATVMKLISFGEPLPSERTRNRIISNQACHFNFADDHTRSRVIRAKLWVYLRPAVMTSSNSSHIYIYKLGPPMYPDSASLSGLGVLTKKIYPKREGSWHSFDVKDVVKEWIMRPDDVYGLQIEAVDSQGNDLPVMIPQNEEETRQKPVIELRFTENRSRQKRRIDDHCDENQNITRCCLYPLTVDFAQMGWTFILNPRTYKANYCSGECPNVYKQNFQHTHVVQQAYAAKKPCCAPKSMKAVSFLYYYSNGNIVYGKVPDMSVESCTCV